MADLCRHDIVLGARYPDGPTSLVRDIFRAIFGGRECSHRYNHYGVVYKALDDQVELHEQPSVQGDDLAFTVTVSYACEHVHRVNRFITAIRQVCPDVRVTGRVPRVRCGCKRESNALDIGIDIDMNACGA